MTGSNFIPRFQISAQSLRNNEIFPFRVFSRDPNPRFIPTLLRIFFWKGAFEKPPVDLFTSQDLYISSILTVQALWNTYVSTECNSLRSSVHKIWVNPVEALIEMPCLQIINFGLGSRLIIINRFVLMESGALVKAAPELNWRSFDTN